MTPTGSPMPCPRCKWLVKHAPDCQEVIDMESENIEQARLLGIAGEEIAGLKADAEVRRSALLKSAALNGEKNAEIMLLTEERDALRAKVEKLVAAGDRLARTVDHDICDCDQCDMATKWTAAKKESAE